MTSTETKKVIFHNNEIIDPASWEIMGVSVKETDSCIGKFGTGLKYAIAVLLRTNHKVSIKAGSTLYKFALVDLSFRGQEFKRISCNGVPLSFTTHYGNEWGVEGAYRELMSNCMDEGGIVFVGEPMDEGTSIIIEGEGILECLKKHEEYFLGDREPIAETSEVDIHAGQGIIYHKGVKVGEIQGASYSYHIKDHIELTEDRTFKYQHTIEQKIGSMITKRLKDVTLLKRFACMSIGFEAEKVDWDWTWSDEFREVIKDLWAKSPSKINPRIQSLIRKKMKEVSFEFAEFSENESAMIEKGKAFLAKAGYPVSAPIKKVESEDTNCIAYEYNGVIHLTQKAFDEGIFLLIVAIFEEQQHVNGYMDFQRDFQTYLIKELIKQAKRATNEVF